MKLVCPACAAEYDTDVAINEANARRFFALLKEFPAGYVGPLIQYLRMHKPAKSALTWTKMLKLSRELQPLVSNARVTRNGSTWAAPLDLWVACTEQLVTQPPGDLILPLKGNGYLLSMVAGQAEKSAASVERAREKKRREVVVDNNSARGSQPETPVDHVAGLRAIRAILDGQKGGDEGAE